jgi:hypothetical protein
MVNSYKLLCSEPSIFLEEIQDGGKILVGCENYFFNYLPSNFQKSDSPRGESQNEFDDNIFSIGIGIDVKHTNWNWN